MSDLIAGSSWQEASRNRRVSIMTVSIVFTLWPKLKLSHLADLNLVKILFEKSLPKVDWDKRSRKFKIFLRAVLQFQTIR